jgi:hypothetical protein
MYAAQSLWDVVMARSILADLAPGETMVVIVGSGHVAYGLGIPRRIAAEAEAAGETVSVATFCPVTAPPPSTDDEPAGHPMGGDGHGMGGSSDAPAQFVRSLADYVGVFPDTGGVVPYPTVGLRLDEEDGRIAVSMVWPDTRAAVSGFEGGDIVLDVNGTQPADLSDLKEMLAAAQWRERLGFWIDRGGVELEIGVLLYPSVDLTEREVAPGWTVDRIVAIDPDAATTVSAPDGPAAPRTVLVGQDDGDGWVEVWQDEVLEEVHELDENRRVGRSLYRTALPDGTVEVLYERDADGTVVGRTKLDRTGKPLK